MPHTDQTWLISNSTSSPLCSLKHTPTAEATAPCPGPEHGCLSFLSLKPSPGLLSHPLTEADIHRTCQDRALQGPLSVGPVTADTKDLLPRFLWSFLCCCLNSVSYNSCQRITLHKHMILNQASPLPHPARIPHPNRKSSQYGHEGCRDHWRQTNPANWAAQHGPSPSQILLLSDLPSPGEEPQLVLRLPFGGGREGALSTAVALFIYSSADHHGSLQSQHFDLRDGNIASQIFALVNSTC